MGMDIMRGSSHCCMLYNRNWGRCDKYTDRLRDGYHTQHPYQPNCGPVKGCGGISCTY